MVSDTTEMKAPTKQLDCTSRLIDMKGRSNAKVLMGTHRGENNYAWSRGGEYVRLSSKSVI